MPPIGEFHPVIVHFVIALGIVGIGLRVISLFPFGKFARSTATVLILIAAAASALAVQSGTDAHGLAERIPGAREAVQKHEHQGEDARNILLGVAALELAALFLRKRESLARGLMMASAAVGVVAAYYVYEAGEHGGELVYSYAGGVGTRTGDTTDVQRLLTAGLFHQARIARDAGRKAEAARLTETLVMQHPNDPAIALVGIESQLKDKADAAGALAALRTLQGPADQPMFAVRRGVMISDAHVALGQKDSARAVLTALATKFPDSRGVKAAMEKLK